MSATGLGPQRRPLRLLCLHGHGGYGKQLCEKLEGGPFLLGGAAPGAAAPSAAKVARAAKEAKEAEEAVEAQCRCIDGPFAEPSRRKLGRQWWRYEGDDTGERPEDWAEMEVAATKLAEAWAAPAEPYDGLLGFSQGAEMVHTAALLAHRGDPRFTGPGGPRFGVSLSGAVNPAHFEAPGAGGPPEGLLGPRAGPRPGELKLPMLFVGDFVGDDWYPAPRFKETLALYKDVTVVTHEQGHSVPPSLSPGGLAAVRGFFARFAAPKGGS